MRRRRPRGVTGRPDLPQRRFDRRLADLRGDYLAIQASPEFVARIQASLRGRAGSPPRRRKALSLSATLACAFLGGFLFGHAPRDLPTGATSGVHHPLLSPPRGGPLLSASPGRAPRAGPVRASTPTPDLLPVWARGLLRADPEPRVRAAGARLDEVLSTSP